MERQKITVHNPSRFSDEISKFFSGASRLEQSVLTITICVYGPLRSDEEWTRVEKHPVNEASSEQDTKYDTRVLQPLIQEWASAMKSTAGLPGIERVEEDKLSKVIFDFNMTPPTDIDETARRKLSQSEPRTITRLSVLLHASFRSSAISFEGVVSGSSCWCSLQQQEKYIAAFPKGQSYPMRRESHMQEKLNYLRAHWLDESMEHFGGYPLKDRKKIGDPSIEVLKAHCGEDGIRCLRLAKEHWEAPHWKEVDVDKKRLLE